MSDFLSINPAPETVIIDGKKYPVPGISMEGVGVLMHRFPNLMADLQARFAKDGAIGLMAIIEVAGPATGAILAAGMGLPGNEDAEQLAAQLSVTTQVKVLGKIVDRTMPDGLGPFVEQCADLMTKFAPPQPPKMRFKVLRRESKPSSDGVTTAATSGA